MACTTNTSNCNCKKVPCGCEQGIHAAPPCATGTPACPNPEPCAETWSDCCVIHNGDSFSYVDKVVPFVVNQGERLCDILQRYFSYVECPPTATATPYGLKSKVVTATTINIGWTPLALADTYEVFYTPASVIAFVSAGIVPQNTSPNLTITGLSPNTTYYVKVIARYNSINSCSSVSLIIKTLVS
jgi:hypothetical protein